MVTAVKSFRSSVARTLRSRRHFSSSAATTKNEITKVVGMIPWSKFLAVGGGYFVVGPLFGGHHIEEFKENAQEGFRELYKESVEIDYLTPGLGESIWCLVGKPFWSTLKGNTARMIASYREALWKSGDR